MVGKPILENLSGLRGERMERTDPQRPSLTRRQQDIVRFCENYIEGIGYPPTLREIGAGVELKSLSSVSYQVRQLQRKGRLSHDVGRPRTTMPTKVARPQSPPGPGKHGRTLVPVIGRTHAGGEVTAFNLAAGEEYVDVPPGIVGTHEHFALEIAGDSMIGKAIIDGDRVVVRRGCEVRNGDTVVAWFGDSDTSPEEGEATLKTFKRIGGHVWLLPENPAYDPILGDQATILGKVVYVSRTVR
jgi:repressor LexA